MKQKCKHRRAFPRRSNPCSESQVQTRTPPQPQINDALTKNVSLKALSWQNPGFASFLPDLPWISKDLEMPPMMNIRHSKCMRFIWHRFAPCREMGSFG